MGAEQPLVKVFMEPGTNTMCYVVSDPETKKAAVIDSVLEFDYNSGRTKTSHADAVIAYIGENNLQVEWVLETHAHADHLSAADYIRSKVGGQTGIGAHITNVQEVFSKVYNLGPNFKKDGSQWDKLFAEDDVFNIGNIPVRVLHTPGHTPACICYLVGGALFTGDTLFMPDYGTARCDFPGGSSKQLYASIQKLLALPDETRVFVGHDYLPGGDGARKELAWETTIGEQRANNKHVGGGTGEAAFMEMRDSRDANLKVPRLIIPSVQCNVRGGRLPEPEDDGTVYLKVPINVLSDSGSLDPAAVK
eukprot:TRINITY_DN3141_c0_g1_i1.p1 TRINITY_DN3141_c0_g1~~TRINITY_DN3141_c0_g1_i1.p1  ORF type:complete len:306 (-),score=56.64 TRINITY_DN3141_c0_g1_i1:419-1336(-)